MIKAIFLILIDLISDSKALEAPEKIRLAQKQGFSAESRPDEAL
ncbi:MAG: hypothetical protein ACLTW7_15780 [Enterococcus sp.]